MAESQTHIVYRMDAMRRWSLCGAALLLCAIPYAAAGSATDGYQWQPALIASVVVAPLAGVMIWLSWRPRLELSDNGIALWSPGLSIVVSWVDVKCISTRPELTGIVLKRPSGARSLHRQRWLANRSSFDASSYSNEQLRLIRELRFIDLRAFGRQLRSPEFAGAVAAFPVPAIGTT